MTVRTIWDKEHQYLYTSWDLYLGLPHNNGVVRKDGWILLFFIRLQEVPRQYCGLSLVKYVASYCKIFRLQS